MKIKKILNYITLFVVFTLIFGFVLACGKVLTKPEKVEELTEEDTEVAKQKPKISKEKAIDIAYREAKKMVDKIIELEEKSITAVDEKAEAMGLSDQPIPPGDSGVYSDKEPEKPEKFKANLDERNKHKITAELTVFKNILQWWIEISNVETNREEGPMGFRTHIDAITGKVLIATYTE
jgi:hypothetical protein